MFIGIHSLHTHVATLLNREEKGQPKTIPVGGILRTRISSQCLKRHLRHQDEPESAMEGTEDQG